MCYNKDTEREVIKMLGTLFDWVKSIGDKIYCRHCDYKTLFAISMIWHLKKYPNVYLTKKDLKLLLKNNFLARLVKFLVACILIPPLFVLKLVCYFFEILGEIL